MEVNLNEKKTIKLTSQNLMYAVFTIVIFIILFYLYVYNKIYLQGIYSQLDVSYES